MNGTFYSEQWYTDRWLSMSPVMRKLAADTVRKALSEEDQELIRRKHAEFGHDWIHHLIDTTPEEREQMNALVREELRGNPEYQWPETMSAHHGFGTAMRNLLRDDEYGAGIKDSDLPPAPYESGETHQCWDDFYTQAIEAAVGVREA